MRDIMIEFVLFILFLCGLMYLLAWSIMRGAEKQVDYHNEMKKKWKKFSRQNKRAIFIYKYKNNKRFYNENEV